MSFESELFAHLSGDATIAAAVGQRIFPVLRPQSIATLPALVYTRIAGQPEQCLDGFTSGLSAIRTQIDCYAETHDAVAALAAAVRDRMLTPATNIKSTMQFDQDLYEDDTRLYRVLMDFTCWFSQP